MLAPYTGETVDDPNRGYGYGYGYSNVPGNYGYGYGYNHGYGHQHVFGGDYPARSYNPPSVYYGYNQYHSYRPTYYGHSPPHSPNHIPPTHFRALFGDIPPAITIEVVQREFCKAFAVIRDNADRLGVNVDYFYGTIPHDARVPELMAMTSVEFICFARGQPQDVPASNTTVHPDFASAQISINYHSSDCNPTILKTKLLHEFAHAIRGLVAALQGNSLNTPPPPPPFNTDTRYALDDPTCGEVGFLAEHIHNGGVWLRFRGKVMHGGWKYDVDDYALVVERRKVRQLSTRPHQSHAVRPCIGWYFVRRWYSHNNNQNEWTNFIGFVIDGRA
eukprot:TRINITY_DN1890_c0_g1_i1.p1 TRINITY_DN1890_c0_g1~~TRINITY_DN1890_c0_g1_i1.p1  ORF type:complete len:332 (+),score=10.88 TRINITY_DN1890_c0_g1_i1:44-1039(+)